MQIKDFKHRVRKFIKALRAKVTQADVEIVKTYLTKQEQILFYRMRKFDQAHGMQVAYKCLGRSLSPEIDRSKLIRAAILHDVGKTYIYSTLFDRIVYVLLCSLNKEFGKNVNFEELKDGYYKKLVSLRQHAEIGAKMLADVDSDQEVIDVVRFHDSPPRGRESYLLPIIRELDKLN